MKLKIVDIFVALGVDICAAGKVELGAKTLGGKFDFTLSVFDAVAELAKSSRQLSAVSIALSTVYCGAVVPVVLQRFKLILVQLQRSVDRKRQPDFE